MTIEIGGFVKHPGQPAWGTGRVLEMIPPDKVRIRFAGGGEKVLLLSLAPLEPADPLPSEEKALAASGPRPRKPPTAVKSHEKLVREFLWLFPGGFRSTAYSTQERDHKVKAHELAVEELSEARLRAAIESGRFDEVVKHALEVMGATNLVFPGEQKALRNGLTRPAAQEEFSRRLLDLLHGTATFQERFEAFAGFLLSAGAASWTTATYFPFILYPREHMFLEPVVTQKAATAYGFPLAYDSRLSWRTYEQALAFARRLEGTLAPLEPADLLDVQSFLGVVGGG